MGYTKQDILSLISGENAIDRTTEAPFGNYPNGRVIEEFKIQGVWLQVAFNPALNNDIDEWVISSKQADTWLI